MQLTQRPKHTGVEIWRGASKIDGGPIVMLATLKSVNSKTGDMIQTWILRTDQPPLVALASGDDESICGGCPHRGDKKRGGDRPRTCYVNVGQAPSNIWHTWNDGKYPVVSPVDISSITAGRAVRLGAYGDPGAVPTKYLRLLVANAKRHTGYTHQWRRFPSLRDLCMASVDSPEEQAEATRRGWRTFRVRMPGEAPMAGEIECPAALKDKDGQQLTQCVRCGLCAGAMTGKSKTIPSISIEAHGGIATMNGITAMQKRGLSLTTTA